MLAATVEATKCAFDCRLHESEVTRTSSSVPSGFWVRVKPRDMLMLMFLTSGILRESATK